MKIKELSKFPGLVQHLLVKMVWPDIKDKPDDGRWRHYSREFLHEEANAILVLNMTYKLDNTFLQLKKLTIEHKPIDIDLDAIMRNTPQLDKRH